MSAFIESLKGEDYVICQNHERPDADIVVMWSWLLGMYGRDAIYNHYKKTNAKFVILEVGALQRNTSWKVAIGGINRDADFGNQTVDNSRLSLFDLTPSDWHAAGDHIIICGQNERSIAWNQGATAQWVNKMIEWIRSQTDRPIWFRPHPRFPVHFKDADDTCCGKLQFESCHRICAGRCACVCGPIIVVLASGQCHRQRHR